MGVNRYIIPKIYCHSEEHSDEDELLNEVKNLVYNHVGCIRDFSPMAQQLVFLPTVV